MEASQSGPGQEATPEEVAAKEAAEREAEAQAAAGAPASEGGAPASDEAAADPTVGGGPEDTADGQEGHEPLSQADEDERNPAPDQSPAATAAQDTIVGDPGLRDEQEPQAMEGRPAGVDTPTRTSAPPPEAQSGVPLPEDRAAGVQPGTPGPVAPEGQDDEAETPEHDGSEGQSTSPPMG